MPEPLTREAAHHSQSNQPGACIPCIWSHHLLSHLPTPLTWAEYRADMERGKGQSPANNAASSESKPGQGVVTPGHLCRALGPHTTAFL